MASPYRHLGSSKRLAQRGSPQRKFQRPRPTGLANLNLPARQRNNYTPSWQQTPSFQRPASFSLGSQPVQLQTLPDTPTPTGLLMGALGLLETGKFAVVSTLKESIDTLQGEGVSPSDWWQQTTNSYGFGDLINDEREWVGYGLLALSPFTGFATLPLGAGVLADSAWSNRAIGFIGDVALDPLTYLSGGASVIARGAGNWKKANLLLGTVKTLDDEALVQFVKGGVAKGASLADESKKIRGIIDKGIEAGEKTRSVSGVRRALMNEGDVGQRVLNFSSLDPGLRFRVPFTGSMARGMRRVGTAPFRGTARRIDDRLATLADDVEGKRLRNSASRWVMQRNNIPALREVGDTLQTVLANQRVRNIPEIDRVIPGTTKLYTKKDIAAEMVSLRKKMPSVDPDLGKVARKGLKGPIEFRLPAGLKKGAQVAVAGKAFARLADAPLRIWDKVPGLGRPTAEGPGGLTRFYRNRMSVFDQTVAKKLGDSPDADQIMLALSQEMAGRSGSGKRSFLDEVARRGMNRITRRNQLGKLEQLDFAEAVMAPDGIFVDDVIDRSSRWFANLPEDIQKLDDETLTRSAQTLKAMFDDMERLVSEDLDLERAIRELRADEGGGYVTRRVRASMQKLFDVDESDFGRGDLTPEAIQQKTVAQSKKSRQWRPNEGIEVRPDMDAYKKLDENGFLFKEGKRAWLGIKDQDGVLNKFVIKSPAEAGLSVRRQIDNVTTEALGEKMFVDSLQEVVDSYVGGMGREIFTTTFMKRMRDDFGFPVAQIADEDLRAYAATLGDQHYFGEAALAKAERVQRWMRRDRDNKAVKNLLLKENAARNNAFDNVEKVLKTTRPDDIRSMQQVQNARRLSDITQMGMEEIEVAQRSLDKIATRLNEHAEKMQEILDAGGKYKVPEEVQELVDQAYQIMTRVAQLDKDITLSASLYPQVIQPVVGMFDAAAADPTALSAITNLANLTDAVDMTPYLLKTSRGELEEKVRLITANAANLNGNDVTVDQLQDLAKALQGQLDESDYPQLTKFNELIKDWYDGDSTVGHEVFISAGILNGVDPAELRNFLDEVVGNTRGIIQDAEVARNLRRAGVPSPAFPRKTVTSLRMEDATPGEYIDVATQSTEYARTATDEAARLRRLADQAKARGVLDPEVIERWEFMAGAAELEAQAALREASDLQSTRRLPTELEAVMEAAEPRLGRQVTDAEAFKIPETSEELEAFINMTKDGMANWGPWQMLGGKELNDQMFDAAIAFQMMNSPRDVGRFMKKFDRIQNWFKAGAIATPGFVYRNIFGAVFNAWLDGIEMSSIALSTRISIGLAYRSEQTNKPVLTVAREVAEEAASKGRVSLRTLTDANGKSLSLGTVSKEEIDHYVTLIENGVRGGGQATRSVVRPVPAVGLRNAGPGDNWLVSGARKTKDALRPINFLRSDFWMYRGIRSLNTQAEDAIRLGIGMDVLKYGGNVDDALARIAKSQFDYSELTDWEKRFGQRLLPFYTWTRKNVPYQLQMLAANPGKYNKVLFAKENLEFGHEDEGVVPDFFVKPFGIRTPWKWAGARVYTVPDLPFQDLIRYDPTAKEGDFQQKLRGVIDEAAWQVTPMAKVPLEVYFQETIGYGTPLTGKFQNLPRPLADIPGLLKAVSALEPTKNSFIRVEDGVVQMPNHLQYIVTSMVPLVGRASRILPSDERAQESLWTSLLSTFVGINAQFQTDERQRKWLNTLRRQGRYNPV